jgi:tetratricopeptide (TPR) repeat protein
MKRILIIVFLFFCVAQAFGQTRADRLFDRKDYLGALRLYSKDLTAATDDTKKDHIRLRMAYSFFKLNDVKKAGEMYKKIDQSKMDAENLLNYAVTLQREGSYAKAKDIADMVEAMGGYDYEADRLKQSCDFAISLGKERQGFSATKTNVDFAGISAGVTYYKNNGVILAAPDTAADAKRDTRGYKFTRLFNAVFSGDGRTARLVPFANELAAEYHVGAVTFTRDFNRIYYTKTILKKDGTSILKLMTAENTGGKWSNIQELDMNSDEYSCAHPSLYGDSLLYFVSDMPGGFGGKDIYTAIVDGASSTEITNLGEPVNTSEDEMFPVIDKQGRLYFASNGHIGLGGLDVFEAVNTDGIWSEPKNMKRPINSSMDDFALVFKDLSNKDGYVSSNRGGTGYYDFLFSLKALPAPKQAEPKVVAPEPVVAAVKEDTLRVSYEYAIQIGAFRNPVPRVYFDKFEAVKVYKGYDNLYRYAVGEYPDKALAEQDVVAVRSEVYDAFVVDVERYIAERKIQNDVMGDVITDSELLLIRLRNLEKEEKRNGRKKRHLYLDRGEIRTDKSGKCNKKIEGLRNLLATY